MPLNNKLQDLWKKEKEEQIALKRTLKEEVKQKISDEILKGFSEQEISEDTTEFKIFALPYEAAAEDKNKHVLLKLIFQQYNKKKTLIRADSKKIQVKLNHPTFKVMGPTCYKVDPEEISITTLPFFLFYTKTDKLDITKEVIRPLLKEINPLSLS